MVVTHYLWSTLLSKQPHSFSPLLAPLLHHTSFHHYSPSALHSETLAPFASLAVLESHPAHLATFIHYALVSHTCQEELVCYPWCYPRTHLAHPVLSTAVLPQRRLVQGRSQSRGRTGSLYGLFSPVSGRHM